MKKLFQFLFKRFFAKKQRQIEQPMSSIHSNYNNYKTTLSIENWSGNDYIRNRPFSSRKTAMRTKGRVHDINKIFNRINKEYFDGKIKAKITYGRYGCKNVQRLKTITFASYSPMELLIRIHPALDSEVVPEYFVEHVIHHEILHEIYPPYREFEGKWRIHHYNFRKAETEIPTYKEAMKWEQKNIELFFKSKNIKSN